MIERNNWILKQKLQRKLAELEMRITQTDIALQYDKPKNASFNNDLALELVKEISALTDELQAKF